MRIVHITDFYLPRLGGVEVQVAGLAARQLADGHDVSVLTVTPATGAIDGSGAVPVLRQGRTAWLGGGTADLPRVLRDADVAHVHLGGVCPMSWQALRVRARLGLPTVVTVHTMLDDLQTVHRLVALVAGWRHASVVWSAVSRTVAQQLSRLLGGTEVHVVPNAVEHSSWAPAPGTALAPRQAELLVVAALRHTRRKRVGALPGVLADALHLYEEATRLEDRGAPAVRAVIAGSGHRSGALQRQLRRAGLADRVELPGRLSQAELRALYRRADVFLAPTVLESFGLAALEARCAGLPVVARRESGTADVLEHETEALLVSSDADMARALAHLLLDTARREEMARHNRETVPRFSWDQTVGLTAHAYHLALATATSLTAPSAAGSRTLLVVSGG